MFSAPQFRYLLIFLFCAAASTACDEKPSYTEKEIQQDPGRFKEVRIGKQVWMEKNLNVVCFRNGDSIPEARTQEEWDSAGKMGKPAWCYYDNDIANGKKYGKLYNWYAVNDPRGLAPAGWHVATFDEWDTLVCVVNPATGKERNTAAATLKSKNDWTEGGNGTNASGFNGLPAGCRSDHFLTQGALANWWCTVDGKYGEHDYGWGWRLINNETYATSFVDDKECGNSVRCVKDPRE